MTYESGFRCTWIDSLCIAQNAPDDDDWNQEVPQMGEIYKNAICNLAATAFGNGIAGLFVERKASTLVLAKALCTWRNASLSQ